MVKRPIQPQTTTDKSFASSYIDDIRNGNLTRIQVKFPLTSDRKLQGNIPYTDKVMHRYFGGVVPEVGRDNSEKEPLKGPYRLNDQEHIFRNKTPNQKHIGKYEIGTVSGVETLIDEPFTPGPQQGYPTDNPVEINDKYEPNTTSAEFVVMGPLEPSDYLTEKYRYRYPVDPNKNSDDNRLFWRPSSDYTTPTSPATRYPTGYLRLNHRWFKS